MVHKGTDYDFKVK